ncbi:MAG: heparinase II/III family protein [Rhodobacterales bacterium]
MSETESWQEARTRLMNRVHARLSTRARAATGFVSSPEPRTTGAVARGRQLIAGNLMFAGHLIEAPGAMIWDLDPPDAAFVEEIQGFGWLDDLAAVGDVRARKVAQDWLWGWIARYGRGQGPGWTPELTGRRLIRWIHHALFILRVMDGEKAALFYRSLAQQTIFLGRRWEVARPGLPRFEALTGLIYAGLSLEGMEAHAAPALRGLGGECRGQVDAEGGIPTRNPEELLEVFTLLTWARAALEEADLVPDPEHVAAIARIAPTLRSLRHSDGSLARFHGGGRGPEGQLDLALAASGVKKRQSDRLVMGYARMSGGRTSLIVDAAAPASGNASFHAHASTLAFELTSGRRPLIVNCGSGAAFGRDWRRAGRATPSHTALCVDGYSSARLGKAGRIGSQLREMLEEAPRNVPAQLSPGEYGLRFEGGQDGYVASDGLTQARMLELAFDGRALMGEDLLMAIEAADKKTFDRRLEATGLSGVPFQLRFHLHPDVDSALDMGGQAVSMALRSGEIWVFRHEGAEALTLEPSVYLEKGRLRPRSCNQIVLSGRAMEYATRIRWSLAKAQDTAIAIRDLAMDEADSD